MKNGCATPKTAPAVGCSCHRPNSRVCVYSRRDRRRDSRRDRIVLPCNVTSSPWFGLLMTVPPRGPEVSPAWMPSMGGCAGGPGTDPLSIGHPESTQPRLGQSSSFPSLDPPFLACGLTQICKLSENVLRSFWQPSFFVFLAHQLPFVYRTCGPRHFFCSPCGPGTPEGWAPLV